MLFPPSPRWRSVQRFFRWKVTDWFYANGTARTDVNTVVTLAKLRAVIRALKRNKADKYTQILNASVNYATRWVEAAYIAVVHTDLESDIRNLAGFIPTAAYGNRTVIHENELGSVEEIRFISSADLESWPNGGGDYNPGGGSPNVVTTSGTKADVYPILIFGRDAFGIVPLRGQGAVTPSIIRPGTISKSDPLGQRGYIGWKTWHTAVILNQAWMARLEVAATLL